MGLYGRKSRKRHFLILLGALLGLASAPPLTAAEKETRTFAISVEGKPAGTYKLTLEQRPDGTVVAETVANVKISYLVYKYKYSLNCTEMWKQGRLLQLQSSCDDDGTRYSVSAQAVGDQLRVIANGQEHTTRWDAWTTSYWHLADPRFRNHGVPLVDIDTGKDLVSSLQYVETQALHVGGKDVNCTHYRLKGGGLQVELWYDPQERLVWQESVDQGRHIVFELKSITP